MALSQLKDSIKRLSDDYNFNFRGIDGSTRLYLGKGKTERDANMTSQEASSIFKSTRK
jgi:transposase